MGEEEDLQEVHLQGCRPRSAPRHEQRAADGVVCLQDQEEVLQGTQEEAHGPDQEAEEEEEGGSRQRKSTEDAPKFIKSGDAAIVKLLPSKPMCVEPFRRVPSPWKVCRQGHEA